MFVVSLLLNWAYAIHCYNISLGVMSGNLALILTIQSHGRQF